MLMFKLQLTKIWAKKSTFLFLIHQTKIAFISIVLENCFLIWVKAYVVTKWLINIFFYVHVALNKFEFWVFYALFPTIVCYVNEFWNQQINWWLSNIYFIFGNISISIFHQEIHSFYLVGNQTNGIIDWVKEYLHLFSEDTIPKNLN